MQRIFYLLVILSLFGLMISCSGTEKMSQQQNDTQKEVSQYPGWYPQQEFVSNDTELLAYATAIDTDSLASVDKAKSWAVKQLETSVSAKLEEIRSDVVSKQGSESGLDEPQFLMALRKAPRAIEPLVETGKTEVQSVEGFESVRGFAEVSVPKDQLIERIGKRLGAHEKAWNMMRDSDAFNNF